MNIEIKGEVLSYYILQRQLEDLKDENSELKDTVGELQGEVNELQSRIEMLYEQLDDYNDLDLN